MKKLRCIVGFHKWSQSRDINPIDLFPPAFIKYERPTRECELCGKKQWWLPGYGGSEIGSWEPLNDR